MSFDAGGHADKLGNRYEGRWVISEMRFQDWKSLTTSARATQLPE
jgi:hypothetical protein